MIYFIYGKDTYRSKAKLNELIQKYSGDPAKDGTSFEVQKVDAEKIKLDEFKNKLNSSSLFVKKRLMVFEDLSQSKEQKEVAEYLKTKTNHPALLGTPPSKGGDNLKDILIFFENKVDKKTSLYKHLKKIGENPAEDGASFEFEEMKPFEIKSWIENYIKSKNGTIERVALEELLMGNVDLWRMSGELDKLLAYNKNITLENVKKLTSANFDDNIFNLADAVGRGDKKKALELINAQLEAGAQPIYLLSMIIRQFRILIQVKEASGKNSNKNMVAKELGLHPFVVQKSVAQALRYSFEELEKIYNNLQEIDLKLKTSKIQPEVLFTQFLFG